MPLNVVMKQNVVIFISYKLNLLLLHKTKRLEHLMVMRTDSNVQKLQTNALPCSCILHDFINDFNEFIKIIHFSVVRDNGSAIMLTVTM